MADERRKRVVSLIRISTLKQKKDKDADYQRNQVRLTCSLKNLEHVREFSLENISGLDVRQTDQFKELKKSIARSDIDGLVLPTMSRLGRTTEFKTLAALMEPFEEIMGGTKKLIWSRTEIYDVTNGDDRDKIWAAFRFAEQERTNLKFITGAQKEVLRLEDDTCMDKLPKGIITIHKTGTIKPKRYRFEYDPEYKKLIAEAYQRVLNGDELTDIAHDLGYDSINGARETLRSEWWIGYKSRLKTTNERKWNKDKQKYFIGGRKNHDNPIRVAIPNLVADPAVRREVWEAVQVKLAEHTNRHLQRRSLSKELLGARYLFCGVCGEPLYHKGEKSRTHPGYFWCKSQAMSYHKNRKKRTVACGIGLIRADNIRDEIALQIQMHLGNRKTCLQLLDDASNVEAIEEKKRRLVRIERQIEEANSEKKRMLRAIQKGIVSEDEYEADLAEVRQTIKALEQKASSVQFDIDTSVSRENRERMADHMAHDFADFSEKPLQQQQMLLKKYVTKITATRPNVEINLRDVRLHFDVKPGTPEMVFQHDSVFPPNEPPKPSGLNGKGPVRVMKGGMIGDVPPIPERRSKLGVDSRPSS